MHAVNTNPQENENKLLFPKLTYLKLLNSPNSVSKIIIGNVLPLVNKYW